ncbi:MAG: heme peroxidase family protein [Saprospiraceae bacterium]
MFQKISHSTGVTDEEEILFSTPFNYLFPEAARSAACLLPVSLNTIQGLKALGNAMADNGSIGDPAGQGDSQIDALFTYIGQFIDHDITARTDRDTTISDLSNESAITPANPDNVIKTLKNGRRPQLDLDSVFGEGPGLAGSTAQAKTQSQILYNNDLKLNLFKNDSRIDLPRQQINNPDPVQQAIIADGRNDENLNISQIQALFLSFYNHVYDVLSGTKEEKYIRARQLVRWSYQYAVVHDYLMAVCDRNIVLDVLANGPRFYSSTAGKGETFMPLEFSVAAFRFGHSMIRPFYKLNNTNSAVHLVNMAGGLQILGPNARTDNFDDDGQFVSGLMINWSNFIGNSAQKARKLDTKIAHDLFTLPFRPSGDPILSSLTTSNLVRGYSLSIPTGQAVCDAMGIIPLSPSEITSTEDPAIAAVVTANNFDTRSPLWYYLLREAAVQQGGERLGEAGSRIVAETLIGLLKQDPNSYMNNLHDPAITDTHIEVTGGAYGKISNFRSLLKFGGAAGL